MKELQDYEIEMKEPLLPVVPINSNNSRWHIDEDSALVWKWMYCIRHKYPIYLLHWETVMKLFLDEIFNATRHNLEDYVGVISLLGYSDGECYEIDLQDLFG